MPESDVRSVGRWLSGRESPSFACTRNPGTRNPGTRKPGTREIREPEIREPEIRKPGTREIREPEIREPEKSGNMFLIGWNTKSSANGLASQRSAGQSHGNTGRYEPSKHAGTGPDPATEPARKRLAGTGREDSCKPACFRNGPVWPKPDITTQNLSLIHI